MTLLKQNLKKNDLFITFMVLSSEDHTFPLLFLQCTRRTAVPHRQKKKPYCVLKELLRLTLLISLLSSDQITPHPSVFLQGFLFFLNFNYFH